MKRMHMSAVTVLALAAGAVASAQEAGKGTAQDAKAAEIVQQQEQEWVDAYIKRAAAFLERFLANDYMGAYPDGSVLDKKREIEDVKSGAVAPTEIMLDEVKIRTYGDAAVITGKSSIKGKVKDQDVSGEYRFMDVLVKQGDRWQAVAGQVTRIAKP
jgi:ketosteroid isomerase-like protein